MADIDFSLLDVPRSVPVDDPEAYLRAAMAWHFGEDTGSPFWLRTAQTLNFDPVTDVKTFADLRLFPNLVNELRSVPVEDLIPRGYGSARAAAPDIRIRRYHRRSETHCAAAGLDRAGRRMANRGLRHGRLRARTRASCA